MAEQTFVPQTMNVLRLPLGPYDGSNQPKASSLVYDTGFPTPKPSPTQYLIKVQTASPCASIVTPSGHIPLVPAHDFCGTIISTPVEDHWNTRGPRFKIGDQVFGLISFDREGAAAEYTLVTEGEIAQKPRNVTAAEAATLPFSSLTVWQAFFEHAGLDPDDTSCNKPAEGALRVLVTNALSDVGRQAIHLLRSRSMFPDETVPPQRPGKHHSVWICATGNRNDLEFIRTELGADVATASTDVAAAFRDNAWDPVDIVLECMGGATFRQVHSPVVVKDGGEVLTVSELGTDKDRPSYHDQRAEARNRALISKLFVVKPNGRQLERIVPLVEKGSLKPSLHSVVDLADGGKAIEIAMADTKPGRVVLRVDPATG